MAIPRRFDRRLPERDTTRINDRIRVKEVRLIGDDGAQIGIIAIADALKYAQERDLDLVEVAPEARPPVCRALDYSKYKYEQAQKAKATRKHQTQIIIREIKLRPKIAQHDYDTKKGHVVRFLEHGDKVKVTIMFRGREREHPERGQMLLRRLADDVVELGTIEQNPIHEGRNMTMVMAPVRTVRKAEEADDETAPVKSAKERRAEKVRAATAAADAAAIQEQAQSDESAASEPTTNVPVSSEPDRAEPAEPEPDLVDPARAEPAANKPS